MIESRVELRPLFLSGEKGAIPPTPLFRDMVLADLNGDGRPEIVLPGSDGRLRVLRQGGTVARPELVIWTTIDTRVEGDQVAGACYLTAAPLAKASSASLVVATPRGIFHIRVEGLPPKTEWIPFCDRTFFDPGQPPSRMQRFDFLADLDGDGVPEIWMPQLESMAFWRRKPGGAAWEEIQLPPLSPRIRQTAGALPVRTSAVQPAIFALNFNSTLNFPQVQLLDLNRDGRCELILSTRDSAARPSTLRAEVYELRDSLHFTTSPAQVRSVVDRGTQEFVDLNGDGFLDLLRVESNLDMVSPRTVVEAYLSPAIRDHTFDRPTSRYVTHDPVGMGLYGDWNRDGMADLAYSEFQYTFGSTDDLISLILGKEIPITVRFLHGTAVGFRQKADQSLLLQIRNRSFQPRLFPPLCMDGDFNGDGLADLLVRERPDRSQIFLSRKESGDLSTRPALAFSVGEESSCRVADVNGDGRSDVVECNPEAQTITVRFARP